MQNLEDKIWKEHANTIYKYLFCITRNRELAEDLTQETFYYAYKYLHTFRGDCKMLSWLRTIAKNEWYKYLKKNKATTCISLDHLDLEQFGYNISPEDDLVRKETVRHIYNTILSFDEETSQILLLRLEARMEYKQIAILFHKTETWARTKFHRANQLLKEVLRDEQQ